MHIQNQENIRWWVGRLNVETKQFQSLRIEAWSKSKKGNSTGHVTHYN